MIGANPPETAVNTRAHLLSLLRMFASPVEQRAYQATVPFVPVPIELVCAWSDDSYHPDSPVHALAFSPRERAALAAFDAELCRWADSIPRDVEVFIASVSGSSLAAAAASALAAFDAEPQTEFAAAPDPAA